LPLPAFSLADLSNSTTHPAHQAALLVSRHRIRSNIVVFADATNLSGPREFARYLCPKGAAMVVP
jgi:hypothetical protein